METFICINVSRPFSDERKYTFFVKIIQGFFKYYPRTLSEATTFAHLSDNKRFSQCKKKICLKYSSHKAINFLNFAIELKYATEHLFSHMLSTNKNLP